MGKKNLSNKGETMETLIKEYRARLKQLNSGSPELYQGEKQMIKEILKKYKKEKGA